MDIQAQLSYGEKDENGNIMNGSISTPESNLGSYSTNLYKEDKYTGTVYGDTYEECKSIGECFANAGKIKLNLKLIDSLISDSIFDTTVEIQWKVEEAITEGYDGITFKNGNGYIIKNNNLFAL